MESTGIKNQVKPILSDKSFLLFRLVSSEIVQTTKERKK
jgi:hypothetical protein